MKSVMHLQEGDRDPKEVVGYVRAHRDELSPLSMREALKNVSPSKTQVFELVALQERASREVS